MGFSQDFLMENYFLLAYYLGLDLSGWIALIESGIPITTGMVGPVSSGKWKALKCTELSVTTYFECEGVKCTYFNFTW